MTQPIDGSSAGYAPGMLAFVLIVSASLALPISLFMLYLYRRAVIKTMSRHEAPIPAAGSASATGIAARKRSKRPPVAASRRLCQQVISGERGAATTYCAGGMIFATVVTGAFFVASDIDILPIRFLLFWWIYAWPVVLTVNLVSTLTLRAGSLIVGSYFLGFTGLCALALAQSHKLNVGDLAIAYLGTNVPPTVFVALFLTRKIRAVGPMVLAFVVVVVSGTVVSLDLAGDQEEIFVRAMEIGVNIGLKPVVFLVVLLVIGIVSLGFVGWALLRWVAIRYEQRKLNDQSLTIDAFWLFFGMFYAVELSVEGLGWILAGPAAFVAFKVASRLTSTFLSRKEILDSSPTLLLLRVFSLGKQGEQLYHRFSKLWRFVGNTRMIAGPDLATATVEPHHFLQFIRGKLARSFIDSAKTLESRVSESVDTPDSDGWHRVSEFFCYDNTWRIALRHLAAESDAVLMDLRRFSPQNAGCKFEIQELVNLIPLTRVVFVVDSTTDRSYLDQVLHEGAARMGPESPNRGGRGGKIRFIEIKRIETVTVRRILDTVCEAASSQDSLAAEGRSTQ